MRDNPGTPPHTPPHTPPTPQHPILLLGASGYVGAEVQRQLSTRHWPCVAVSRQDLKDQGEGVAGLLDRVHPSFLFNAAGRTGKPTVDWCEASEANKSLTWADNVTLPGAIGRACRAAGVPWGHVSSGCVYQGDGPGDAPQAGWRERDPPAHQDQVSYYARTKIAGEFAARGGVANSEVVIWRIRMPFDHRDSERNYLSKLLRYPKLLQAHNSLSHLPGAVWAMLECWARGVPWGIYHVTNPGSVWTSEVVEMLFDTCDWCGDPARVSYFPAVADFQRSVLAQRSSCVLNTDKLEGVGIRLPEVREALVGALAQWEPKGDAE